MSITDVALAGMTRVQADVERSAVRLAQAGSASGDSVDLSAEMAALVEAKNSYAALAKVAALGDELSQTTLNILA